MIIKKEDLDNLNNKEIKVVFGNKFDLEISDVNDCVNTFIPNSLSQKINNVIIPIEKKNTDI